MQSAAGSPLDVISQRGLAIPMRVPYGVGVTAAQAEPPLRAAKHQGHARPLSADGFDQALREPTLQPRGRRAAKAANPPASTSAKEAGSGTAPSRRVKMGALPLKRPGSPARA